MTPGASPYTPSGNLTINSGVTLDIKANVTIKMNSATKISVSGKLIAENATFTYNGTGSKGAWDGIYFESGETASSNISKCNIKYGYRIYCNNAAAHSIQNCTRDSSVYGIYSLNNDSLSTSNNIITPSRDGGMRLYNSSFNIAYTDVDYNINVGIHCEHYASPKIWESRIRHNDSHGFYNYDYSCGTLIPAYEKHHNSIHCNAYREV